MIDLDRMDAQLALALTESAPSASTRPPALQPPVPVPAPTPAPVRASAPRRRQQPVTAPEPRRIDPAGGVDELLALGLIDEVDSRISAATDRCDAVTWATMRALLDGRRDAAHTGLDELLGLSRAGDRRALDRHWAQRFWFALEWGGDEERHDVLDHCRERAYRFDDLHWWGNLSLLLAAMGKADEATRAFDAAQELLGRVTQDALWLDVVTNSVEAAALLGDAGRAAAAHRSLRWPEGRLVVVGQGVVCKGSVDRYRGLGYLALGSWGEAGGCFRRAEAAHRALGAGPLLTRTLQQAAGSLSAA